MSMDYGPLFVRRYLTHTNRDRQDGWRIGECGRGWEGWSALAGRADPITFQTSRAHIPTHDHSCGNEFRFISVMFRLVSWDFFFITLQKLVWSQVHSEGIPYLAPFSVGRIHTTSTLHQNLLHLTATSAKWFWWHILNHSFTHWNAFCSIVGKKTNRVSALIELMGKRKGEPWGSMVQAEVKPIKRQINK